MKDGKSAMSIYAVVMLMYTGWRVLDYMLGSLTGVDRPVALLVSIAFLAFSEIGLLLWLHVARPNATTDAQETAAKIMIWVDFAASMLIGLADLAKHNTLYIVDLTSIDPLLFFAPWLTVVANLAAYLIYHMNDSEEMLARMERATRHAEVSLKIATIQDAIADLRLERLEDSKATRGNLLAKMRRSTRKYFDERYGKPAELPSIVSSNGNGKAHDGNTYEASTELMANPTKRQRSKQ